MVLVTCLVALFNLEGCALVVPPAPMGRSVRAPIVGCPGDDKFIAGFAAR